MIRSRVRVDSSSPKGAPGPPPEEKVRVDLGGRIPPSEPYRVLSLPAETGVTWLDGPTFSKQSGHKVQAPDVSIAFALF